MIILPDVTFIHTYPQQSCIVSVKPINNRHQMTSSTIVAMMTMQGYFQLNRRCQYINSLNHRSSATMEKNDLIYIDNMNIFILNPVIIQ